MPIPKNPGGGNLKTYVIWSEGYVSTGNSAGAHRHGTSQGTDFKDACFHHFITHGKDQGRTYYDPKRNTYWGCRLFDNEADARKRFG